MDVDPTVRLQLVRDKFITGQQQLALRRHLVSAGSDTPISSIVDKCRVWESHEERQSRTKVECEPGISRGVFQVRKQVRDDQNEEAAEPDSNYTNFGNLTNRLRELVQQPGPVGSGPVDIGQLLRQLLPIDDEVREIGQPTSETESVDNHVSGKCGLIRGGGLVTRISADMEPQRDDYSNYCDEPDVRVDSVILNSSGTQWSNDRESDDSEDDDILPTEEYWAIPDDGWTLVEKPHGKPRGVRIGHRRCSGDLDGRLNNKGLRYDELDDIVDTTVLSNYQKKVVQITDTFVETSSDTRTVSVDVKPIVNEQPDRLVVISMDKTDSRDDCLMNMVLAPRGKESEYNDVRTQPVELLPESRVVVQNEMAEEVITGGLTNSGDIITGMTEMGAIADDEVVVRPVPRLLEVEVMEETEAVEISLVECIDGQVVKNETTKPGVSTELVNLPQKWITRGFLELAEEARLVDVRLTPSSCMNESVQRITEIKEPMSRDISWKIEEVMERSVDSFSDVATRMPTVKFDIGQLMQWPNGKSTGMMICEYTLESQMFSHGPVWREAEPVFVAAESVNSDRFSS